MTQYRGNQVNPNRPFEYAGRTYRHQNQWNQGYYAAGMGQNVMQSRREYTPPMRRQASNQQYRHNNRTKWQQQQQ